MLVIASSYVNLWAKHAEFVCIQLLLGFHIRLRNVFGNVEFKLIAKCNSYSIFSCISIPKSCKPKLYCTRSDRADFCTVCHMLD